MQWGKANDGACHTMFKKNYWQLLVNAYDRDQLWRPLLVALLLIPALALSWCRACAKAASAWCWG